MGYTFGIKWSDEEITKQIFKVMGALNIKRMPSVSEIVMIQGNTTLANAIRRNGGFYKWSDSLGLKVKNCETQTGKGYEKIAIEILKNKGYTVERMTTKYPFDLLVNNNISIDVKVAKQYESKGSLVHTVGINKKYATCDIYLIFLLDANNKLGRTLLIPGNELKHTTLNLGKDSIYNKYIDRWDYLDKYNNFYAQLA